MKAAHAIASEIVLDKVLDRMMRIIAESAGAQRGVLLLDRDGEFVVEASIAFDQDKVEIGPSAEFVAFAGSVVDEVARIGKMLVLEDARTDARFAADPYIQEHRPRSVLCLSMSHQGRRTGILYLENNAASDVFTPDPGGALLAAGVSSGHRGGERAALRGRAEHDERAAARQ